MRVRVVAVAALAAALSACTHHRSMVLESPSSPAANAQLSRDLHGRTVTLTLANGSRVDAPDARLDGRSLTWQQPGAAGTQTMDLADVRELSFRSRMRGALDGLLIGLAIGAPAGALIIDAPNGGTGSRGEAALSGGVSIGILAALIGAARGGRIVYRPTAPRAPDESAASSPGPRRR